MLVVIGYLYIVASGSIEWFLFHPDSKVHLCTNPQIVAKGEQILCMTSGEFNELAAKPKFVAQSRPALYYSHQRVDRAG